MQLSKSVLTAIRIVVPLLILSAGGIGFRFLAGMRKPPTRSRPPVLLPRVKTVAARAHSGELRIDVDGTVVPFREIELSAEVAGRIVTKPAEVQAGRFVTAGQLLIEIDQKDYRLELTRQEQLHAQAVASIDETQADLDNSVEQIAFSEKDLQRAEADLVKVVGLRSKGAATETDQDNAEQNVRAEQSTLAREKNARKLLLAKLARLESARDLAATEQARARLDLDRCRIVSPCEGVIVADSVELDSFVQRGIPLIRIQDTSAAEVRTSLRATDIYWLWQHSPGAEQQSGKEDVSRSAWEIPDVPVWVTFDLNGATFRWDGRLARHEGPGLNERTRTIPCRVVVDNPTSVSLASVTENPAVAPPALFRGMFVTVQLRTNPREKLIEVPEQAIRPGSIVWKVDDGKLQRLEVRVARISDGRALIHAAGSSLNDGDPVVVSPLSTETSGMKVKVHGESESEPDGSRPDMRLDGDADPNPGEHADRPANSRGAAR